MNANTYLSIKDWAEDDRPREKLLTKGKEALSDAELIAILIGSGTTTMSAVDLSKRILKTCNNDLNELAQLSIKDLQKFKGIGDAKAISITSALELGRRRSPNKNEKKTILSSKDVYEAMKPHLLDKSHEEFWIIMLSRSNTILKKASISQGGVSSTTVDPKVIFKIALEQQASSLILIHNHPSGNLSPSHADKKITEKIKNAAQTLEINLLDHIIFANEGFFSFADQDLL